MDEDHRLGIGRREVRRRREVTVAGGPPRVGAVGPTLGAAGPSWPAWPKDRWISAGPAFFSPPPVPRASVNITVTPRDDKIIEVGNEPVLVTLSPSSTFWVDPATKTSTVPWYTVQLRET